MLKDKSNSIYFQDFNDFLRDTFKNELPNSELVIIKSGDFIKDTIMEIRQQNIKLQYKPYELYEQSKLDNNFEEIVYNLINQFRSLLNE